MGVARAVVDAEGKAVTEGNKEKEEEEREREGAVSRSNNAQAKTRQHIVDAVITEPSGDVSDRRGLSV